MATPAKAERTATSLQPANHFELRRGRTRIVYTAANIAGEPVLTYDDGDEQRSFTGESEVQRERTALGTLVTVNLDVVADGPTDALTVVLPEVLLQDDRPERFRTPVVFNRIEGSLAGRPLDPGAVQTYAVKTYRGKGSFIMS